MAETPRNLVTDSAGASSFPVPLTRLLRTARRRSKGGRSSLPPRPAALPLVALAIGLLCACPGAGAAPLRDGPARALCGPERDVLCVKADARERARAERRRWQAERRRKAQKRAEAQERAAAAATVPSAATGGWHTLAAAYFPGHEAEALYVIRGESGGNARASNGTCRGLFQIHQCHAAAFQRVTGLPYFDGVYDPEANFRFAAYLSGGGRDWSAWSVRP